LAITHQFITKKLIVGFLKFLDDNLKLEKLSFDSVNHTYATRKLLNVPIQFGIHDKLQSINTSSSARKAEAPQAPVELGRIVPRCGVSLTGIVFDTSRHLNKTNHLPLPNGQFSIAPVPYNLEVEVSILTKSLDDTLQLMETIIPFFSPTLSLDLSIFGDAESIPIGLNTVNFDWPTELSETDERIFTTSYYFTIRANYYLQKKTGKRIETIEVNFKDVIDQLWEKYTITAKHPLPSDYPDTPKEKIPVATQKYYNGVLVANSEDTLNIDVVNYDSGIGISPDDWNVAVDTTTDPNTIYDDGTIVVNDDGTGVV